MNILNKKNKCLLLVVELQKVPSKNVQKQVDCVSVSQNEKKDISINIKYYGNEDNSVLIGVPKQEKEIYKLFNGYVKKHKENDKGEKESKLVPLGRNWFVDDLGLLINALLSKGNVVVSKITVRPDHYDSLNLVTYSSEEVGSLKDVRDCVEPKMGSKEKQICRKAPLELAQRERKPKESDVVKNLQEILEELKKNNAYMGESNSIDADVLIRAIKLGIQQLANKKEDTSSQSNHSDAEIARLSSQLNEKNNEISDLKDQLDLLRKGIENRENAIKQEKDSQASKESELKQKITLMEKQSSKMSDRIKQLEASNIDIKGELVSLLDLLIEDLSQGGYIFNSNGELVDDTFLINKAKELQKKINAVDKPSTKELREEFKRILRNELDDKKGFFSKLACYVAYARLPFMIEPHDKGMFLRPMRVFSIYNKAASILMSYGFCQIIPQLFVETLQDGDYIDVTGQAYSSLADMCPQLDQHKEKVDREQKEGVIKDIAKVGYYEEGRLVKTEVIV